MLLSLCFCLVWSFICFVGALSLFFRHGQDFDFGSFRVFVCRVKLPQLTLTLFSTLTL